MKGTLRLTIISVLFVLIINFFNIEIYANTTNQTKTNSNNSNTKTHSNGIYKIAIGKLPSKTFEVAGSSKENNAKVDIWNYGNVPAQKFYFEYQNGFYKIMVMHTGKSLTVKNNSIQEGTEIVQADYSGSNGQKWLLKDTKKNGWTISPLNNPDFALTVQNNIQNGSKIILSKTKNNDNQMLYIFNINKEEAYQKAVELLQEVGITDAEKRMKNYPHQLSGGMRQRVVIAIALSCDPYVLICDEPTTALDVTIQATILELIQDIQRKKDLSVIYITHDLGVVAKVADFVNVMYAGKIIETGTINEIFYDPRHPYTWGLLSSMPDLDTDDDELYTIPGTPPNLAHEIKGDAFAPRNQFALNIDLRVEPPMFDVPGSNSHKVASWLMHEKAPKVEMPETLKKRIEKMKEEGLANGK